MNYGELLLLLFLVLTALYSFMIPLYCCCWFTDCCWCQAKDPPASLDEQDMLDACRLTETRLMCIEEERRLTVMAKHGKGLKRTWLLLFVARKAPHAIPLARTIPQLHSPVFENTHRILERVKRPWYLFQDRIRIFRLKKGVAQKDI